MNADREWSPGELLELSGQYWATCTLHAGIRLDVFTAIGNTPQTVQVLSQQLQTNEAALRRLLNALAAMKLLTKSGNTYANVPSALPLLVKDSPRYLGHMVLHHQHLLDSWSQLSQAVATGQPVRTRASDGDDVWREHFLMGMFTLASQLAPQLVTQVDLSSCRRLLDLGGGPGTYAIYFCRQYPQLKATVFDLPTTRPFAAKMIERFGLSDRIAFKAGNYLEDDITASYDAAWLSHILHAEGPEDCVQLLRKAVAALTPGGRLIVHEFILDDTEDAPLFPALFSLNMLLGTDEGKAYCQKELLQMMTAAGLRNLRRIPVNTPNDSGLLMGERP